MSPVLVLRLIADRDWEAGLMFAVIVLGAVGIWGMLQLTIKVIAPTANVVKAGRLKVYLASGFLALMSVVFLVRFDVSNISWLEFSLLLPAVVTSHFIFLARRYLWAS